MILTYSKYCNLARSHHHYRFSVLLFISRWDYIFFLFVKVIADWGKTVRFFKFIFQCNFSLEQVFFFFFFFSVSSELKLDSYAGWMLSTKRIYEIRVRNMNIQRCYAWSQLILPAPLFLRKVLACLDYECADSENRTCCNYESTIPPKSRLRV
jgi:hypothetical protein